MPKSTVVPVRLDDRRLAILDSLRGADGRTRSGMLQRLIDVNDPEATGRPSAPESVSPSELASTGSAQPGSTAHRCRTFRSQPGNSKCGTCGKGVGFHR